MAAASYEKIRREAIGEDIVRLGSELTVKERLTVDIRWKGPKATLGSLRRSVKRDDIKKAVAESEVVYGTHEQNKTQTRDNLFRKKAI